MSRINILSLIARHHKSKIFLLLITVTVLINTLLFTHVYTSFDIIEKGDIPNYLVTIDKKNGGELCPFTAFDNLRLQMPNQFPPEDLSSWTKRLNISKGGWQPSHCVSRFTVAIIIPYRNREHHLQVFLYYIHRFLQKQNIHYRIYVIEQSVDKQFNRGKLFNVGFVEASKDQTFPCFIFHDVDLIPQNLNNIYACTKYPRHMASSIDKFRYVVPYDRNFGGVCAFLAQHFKEINGFSNLFFGWGGEDDDLFNRVRAADLQLYRFSQDISRYVSLAHEPATPGADRFDVLNKGRKLRDKDGLNSLVYQVKSKIYKDTHVHILVDL